MALGGLANAAPRARPVKEPALAEALASSSWDEAEQALRIALAEELAQVDAPPPTRDWPAAAQALELSRTQGSWQARWQLRVFVEALRAGDASKAREALRLAEEAAGAPFEKLKWRLRFVQAWTLLRLLAPWILATLVAYAIGVGLDRLATQRRRERRQRVVLNPYITGRPLRDDTLVYGREAILRTLVSGLRSRRSYYLTGERRIGKTTLLLQLGHLNQLAGGTSVFVDVAGTSGDQALGVAERALGGAARSLGLPQNANMLETARQLAARGPLLVLVDEVDGLNNASELARRGLRELALDEGAPGSLVAAGVGLDLARDDEARNWRAALQVLDVEPLTPEAGRALLTEPVKGSLSWTDSAVERVLSEADGRPMVIQLYGLNVVDKVGARPRGKVHLEDVEACEDQVRRAWRAIRDHGLEDELVPVDLDSAHMELGRLRQEIDELQRMLELRP